MCIQIYSEVLHNEYHSISVENWNQTLRKAKAFHQSWAAAKIRALYPGPFCDQITKCNFEWNKNDQIQLKEIVTLKLYTDFDKLQFELKKCFRWEYTQEVVEKNNPSPKAAASASPLSYHKNKGQYQSDSNYNNATDLYIDNSGSSMDGIMENNDEEKKYFEHNINSGDESFDYEQEKGNIERRHLDRKHKYELQDRLQQFYHWRQSLVVILNKYGHKIRPSDSNDILYHGVNAKMILNPAITPAFYGPLSTSSSFHVAKTFATDKGMQCYDFIKTGFLMIVIFDMYTINRYGAYH